MRFTFRCMRIVLLGLFPSWALDLARSAMLSLS